MMLRSEQINELAAALAKAQGVMGNAVMNRINPHFKSPYADMGSVLDAIRPPLSSNGLSVVQPIRITEHGLVLHTMLMHSSGQYIAAEYPLPSTQNQQALGSALTYARRYSLATLVCNASDDDDDAQASQEATPGAAVHHTKLPNVAYVEQSGDKVQDDVVLSTLDDLSEQEQQDERDLAKATYLKECRDKILSYPDQDIAVLKWWASDEQHKKRRYHDLTPGEVDYLKNLVVSKLPEKYPHVSKTQRTA